MMSSYTSSASALNSKRELVTSSKGRAVLRISSVTRGECLFAGHLYDYDDSEPRNFRFTQPRITVQKKGQKVNCYTNVACYTGDMQVLAELFAQTEVCEYQVYGNQITIHCRAKTGCLRCTVFGKVEQYRYDELAVWTSNGVMV